MTRVVCADAKIPDVETNVRVEACFSKSDRNTEPLLALAVKMGCVNTVSSHSVPGKNAIFAVRFPIFFYLSMAFKFES